LINSGEQFISSVDVRDDSLDAFDDLVIFAQEKKLLSSTSSAVSSRRPANAVLAALPDDEYARIAPQLRPLHLKLGTMLHAPGEVVKRVYFPISGIISCVLISDEGTEVEVGLIGREGAACALSALTGIKNPMQIVAQSSGDAWFLTADQLQSEFARGGALQREILRHVQLFSEQTGQIALCNRLHSIEERLARWLLMVQDRVNSDQLDLTQEFLADMLGSRRAGVTLAAGALKKAGFIKYTRGKITILDRPGLEEVACECYDVLREQFQNAFIEQ
jgi:CRP-like cAMP-binding protein